MVNNQNQTIQEKCCRKTTYSLVVFQEKQWSLVDSPSIQPNDWLQCGNPTLRGKQT